MLRHVVRLAATVVLTVAAGLVVSAPAQASTCATSHGVTVVVDFHGLGGGAQSHCDLAGAGRTAATQLTDVGYRLAFVQRQPGFVCRVNGTPADDPCVNTPPSDAYWSLWWSDGKSGTWNYASVGAGSLTVPAGGYVALSWQGGTDRATPRVAPSPHPAASPTPRPSAPPTAAPITAHATAGPTQQAAPSSSSTARTAPSRSPAASFPVRSHHTQALKATPQGKHANPPTSTQATRPARATSESGSGSGLPGWVAPVLVVLLFAAAAAVAVVRRRRSGGA